MWIVTRDHQTKLAATPPMLNGSRMRIAGRLAPHLEDTGRRRDFVLPASTAFEAHPTEWQKTPDHRSAVPKRIFIAVDLEQRTPDVVALGRLLSDATGAPTTLVTVSPYDPLGSSEESELVALREESQAALLEFSQAAGLDGSEARVIRGQSAARELQQLSEERDTGVLDVGSTTRGTVGRLLLGGVGQRLVSGAACPIAVATRGYGDRDPRTLDRIGVGFD